MQRGPWVGWADLAPPTCQVGQVRDPWAA